MNCRTRGSSVFAPRGRLANPLTLDVGRTNEMKPKMTISWRWIYVILFLSSIALVRLQRILPEALDRTRYGGNGLMPFDCLMIQHLGSLSPTIPVLLLILFALSWNFRALNSASAIAITSTVLLLSLGIYTLLCILALFMHL